MIILIATVSIILYIILFSFTLHNLSTVLNVKTKVVFMAISMVAMLVFTHIVFSISTNGLNYYIPDMVGKVRLIMLIVFIPVNGLIVMPYLANTVSKIINHDITQEKTNKRIITLLIIFVLVLIFECYYFKTTQQGIINLINNK